MTESARLALASKDVLLVNVERKGAYSARMATSKMVKSVHLVETT